MIWETAKLDVLFHQDSLSIGGGLPESDFYYDAE